MKLFDELEKYCKNNGIRLQIDVFRKDKNRYELTLDNFSPEELKNIRDIISDYAKIEDDVYLAGNGRAIDIYFETLDESKKSARKSIKESINGDCYIYYDDDDSERLVFCDYVKGITDTSDWFYLNEYIIDAIHVFKNEKQAQKFIDEHLKYFADQDKVVIAEYPQTVSGFFESKKSARKSLKEERYNVELSDYSGSIVDEETFDKKSDAIQWAKDNGRNCYARIWDNEEGKTVKEWKVKSIKESKNVTVEDFVLDDNHKYFSICDIKHGHKSEFFWGTKKDVLNSDYKLFTVLDSKKDDKTEDMILYIDLDEDAWHESKKSMRNSIKENKMILSFEAFKDICVEEIGYSYIGSFDEHKGTYFVSVFDDKRADKFCKYLRDNYDCECTFWKITDPYDDDYGLYEIEVI